MRVRRPRAFVPVAAVAASTVLLACHRGDSILLVEVAGDVRLQPASFQVTVEPAQAGEKTFRVVPPGGATGATVTLPASFSIEMAPNLTGPVTVMVGAIDVNGLTLGYGSTTETDINVGGETILVVSLTSSSLPPADAGIDALTGTGGDGVDASGAGGVGGSGVAGSGLGGRGGSGGTGGAGSGGAGGSAGKGGVSGSGGKSGSGGTSGTGGVTGAGGAGGAGGGAAGTTGSGGAAGRTRDAGGATDAGGDV
jgi:hypothetical protein